MSRTGSSSRGEQSEPDTRLSPSPRLGQGFAAEVCHRHGHAREQKQSNAIRSDPNASDFDRKGG